jgi:hypothetical protein
MVKESISENEILFHAGDRTGKFEYSVPFHVNFLENINKIGRMYFKGEDIFYKCVLHTLFALISVYFW